MSLELNGVAFTGTRALNVDILDTRRQIADIQEEQKNSFVHSVAFKILTLGIGCIVSAIKSCIEENQINQLKEGMMALHRQLDDAVCKKDNGLYKEEGFQIQMVDEIVHFRIDEMGQIFARMADESEDQEYKLDASVEALRYKLAEDMFNHPDIFGREELCNVLPIRFGKDRTRQQVDNENSYERRIFELAIESCSNIRADRLHNVTTANLGELARTALMYGGSADEVTDNLDGILKKLDMLISADGLTSVEAEALVEAFQAQPEEVKNTIVVSDDFEKAPSETTKPEPAVKIPQSYREFFIDLFATEFDKGLTDAKNVKKIMVRHAGAIAEMIHHPDALEQLCAALRADNANTINQSFADAIENINDELLKDLKELFPYLVEEGASVEDVKECLEKVVGDEAERERFFKEKNPTVEGWNLFIALGKLGKLAGVMGVFGRKLMGATPRKIMEQVTVTMEANFKQMFKSDLEVPKWEYAKTIKDMLASAKASAMNNGYMKFVQHVLKNYFKEADLQDQRAMVAAALRYGRDGASDLEMFGAMLKGAGPLLQKMLQGLDESNFGKDFREIFKDVKQHLAPVDHEQIQAYLLDVKNRSGGKIEKITAKKNLGAASVGEVVDCELQIKGLDSPKSVAVKMLRPDALNRIKREKEKMLKYAEQCGMKTAYEAQLETILGEFDFTEEAENIRKGQIYNKGSTRVKSVKAEGVVAATPSVLVMEKAPGRTVEDVITDTRKQIAELKKKAATDPEGAKNDLTALYSDLEKMHNDICIFARQWFAEGIFGSGFSHGDLHGANITLDPKTGLTVLDWGNAIQLTAVQKEKITKVMAAAFTGVGERTGDRAVDFFIDGFRGLLTGSALEKFDLNAQGIRELVTKVLSAGEKRDTGSRIFIILTKLQEMGVEIPGPIFAFSQSEDRLESAIDRLAKVMNELRGAIFSFSRIRLNEGADVANSYNTMTRAFAEAVERGSMRENVGFSHLVENTYRDKSTFFENDVRAERKENILSLLTDVTESGEKVNRTIKRSIAQFKYMKLDGVNELEKDYNEYFELIEKPSDNLADNSQRKSFNTIARQYINPVFSKTEFKEFSKDFENMSSDTIKKAWLEVWDEVDAFYYGNNRYVDPDNDEITVNSYLTYLQEKRRAADEANDVKVKGSFGYFKAEIYKYMLDVKGKRHDAFKRAIESLVSEWQQVVAAGDPKNIAAQTQKKANELRENIVNRFMDADRECLNKLYDESMNMAKDISDRTPETFVDCITDVLGQNSASVIRRTGTGLANLARKA